MEPIGLQWIGAPVLGLQPTATSVPHNPSQRRPHCWFCGEQRITDGKDDSVAHATNAPICGLLFDEMKQVCRWNDTNAYSHRYPMQRQQVTVPENRMAKFLNGIYIHRMLSHHPNAATRASVVPYYWANFSNDAFPEGNTLVGKGEAIKWAELTRTERATAVQQLWMALSCMQSAGVEHYDVAKKNITRHDNRFKFLDFDNSVIFAGATERGRDNPMANLQFEHHTSHCSPEYKFALPRRQPVGDVFVLAGVSADILYESKQENALEASTRTGAIWSYLDTRKGMGMSFTQDAQDNIVKLVSAALEQTKANPQVIEILRRGMTAIPASRASAQTIARELNAIPTDTWYTFDVQNTD